MKTILTTLALLLVVSVTLGSTITFDDQFNVNNQSVTLKNPFPFIDVKSQGARGDTVFTRGTLQPGSNILGLTNTLTTNDIGKMVLVFGVADAGAGHFQDLVTTISSVSGTNATLAVAGTFGATNISITYGHDDTAVLQGLLTAGTNALYFPPGRYLTYPTDWTTGYQISCLTITSSNTILKGAGRGLSMLVCNGAYTNRGGTIIRGNGFFITPSASAAAPMANVSFEDLDIYGGLPGLTSAHGFPADFDGSGWDVTHKAITWGFGGYSRGLYIRRCEIHGWRGEMIFGGGIQNSIALIQDCTLRDGNASLVNMTTQQYIVNNELLDCYLVSEMGEFQYQGQTVYSGNVISNFVQGIATSGSHTNISHPVVITGNSFMNSAGSGVLSTYGKDLTVTGNHFKDIENAFTCSDSGAQGNESCSRNVIFANNFIQGLNSASGNGMSIAGNLTDAKFSGNVVRGKQFGFSYFGSITNVVVSDNMFEGMTARVVAGNNALLAGAHPIFKGNTWFNSTYSLHWDTFAAGATNNITYSGEAAYVNANEGTVHEARILNDGFETDGLETTIYSIMTLADSVYHFGQGDTNYIVGTDRYLRGKADSITFRFNSALQKWVETKYLPDPTWYSPLDNPTNLAARNWVAGEYLVNRTNATISYHCTTTGKPGDWVTHTLP